MIPTRSYILSARAIIAFGLAAGLAAAAQTAAIVTTLL